MSLVPETLLVDQSSVPGSQPSSPPPSPPLSAAMSAYPTHVPMACRACGMSNAAVHAVAATSPSAAAASSAAPTDPFVCPARRGAAPPDNTHDFIPIPQFAGHQAPTAAPALMHVQQARVSYDRNVRMDKHKLEAIVVALKTDLDNVPQKKQYDRNDLINRFIVLSHLTDAADHMHAGVDEKGCYLDMQNFAIDALQLHLVPDSSLREVSKLQCLNAIGDIIPLPEHPGARHPTSTKPQPRNPPAQRPPPARGDNPAHRRDGRRGQAPPPATIAPSATRTHSATHHRGAGGGDGAGRRGRG